MGLASILRGHRRHKHHRRHHERHEYDDDVRYGIDIAGMEMFYKKELGLNVKGLGKEFPVAGLKKIARAVIFAGLAALVVGGSYKVIIDSRNKFRLYQKLKEGNVTKEEALGYMKDYNISVEDAMGYARRYGYTEEDVRSYFRSNDIAIEDAMDYANKAGYSEEQVRERFRKEE